MTNQVAHPMVKFQRKVSSLVESKLLKPEDSIGKIAMLYGTEWTHWKKNYPILVLARKIEFKNY